MKILAIETSCDETAIALVSASGGLKKPRFKVLKNLVASQIKIHQPFGGVVPSLAKREHLKNLPILYKKLLASGYALRPDLIAATVGPGLEPCLWTGINFARDLYRRLTTNNQRPITKIIGVNHLEAHLYSNCLPNKSYEAKPRKIEFPGVALIISGGHTILLLMKDLTRYKKLGETKDDAVGEAFDKIARLLNLPYPGGPEIEKLAKFGNPASINFPRPMINQKNYDFSFSGLKTAVLYYLRGKNIWTSDVHNIDGNNVRASDAQKLKNDVAAAFQQAAFDVLISKTLRAAKEFKAKSILISGGVSANKTFQRQLEKMVKRLLPNSLFIIPNSSFCADNATMVAAAGYINFLQNKNRRLAAQSNLNL